MSSSENSSAGQKKYSLCESYEANSYMPINSTGSISSDVTDSMVPLTGSHDPESGSKNHQSNLYFGGYTLFEVFCLILIALSGLSILILLLTWGPITTLQLKSWRESNSLEGSNTDNNGIKSSTHESNVLTIMTNSVIPSSPKNDTAPFFSGSEVRIKSFKDFNQITESTTGLKVESLTDNPEIVNSRNSGFNDKIQRLELLGPISRAGLEMLFTKFPSIQYLYVDVDEVMLPLSSKKNPLTINMQQLTSIFLQNSENTKLFDWPVKIGTPRLRKLKVVDAILNESNFKQVREFVADVQETLEEIEITECFICEECDIADVQYDNLVKITVNKRRLREILD